MHVATCIALVALFITTAAGQNSTNTTDCGLARKVDIVFTNFTQNSDAAQEAEIFRVMGNLASETGLPVSFTRFTFEKSRGGRVGNLFGNDVRVRMEIAQAPEQDCAIEKKPDEVLVVLLSKGQQGRTIQAELQNIKVKYIDGLSSDYKLYTYPVLTAWDLLYTLLIAAAGAGFFGFIGFVYYKYRMASRFEEREKALEEEREAEEEEEMAEKQDGPMNDEELMQFDRTDVDREGNEAINQLVDVIQRNQERSMLRIPNLQSSPGIATPLSAGTPANYLPDAVANSMAVRTASSLALPPIAAMRSPGTSTPQKPTPAAQHDVNSLMNQLSLPPGGKHDDFL